MRRHSGLIAEVVLKVTCPGENGALQCRQCKVPYQGAGVLCAGER